MPEPLYGAIEAGGSKFVCAAARDVGTVVAEARIQTTDPATTLAAVGRFFADVEGRHGAFRAFGVGTFGPVDLRRTSPSYGRLLATPKAGWAGTDLLTPITARFSCPVSIDTDVNAAALAEATLGAGRGSDTVVYVTVGTGIGAGICVRGRTLQGLLHPEMGHIRVARPDHDRGFAGVCPFHGDCLEGVASGAAITARYGAGLERLPGGDAAAALVGDYLGQLAANIVLTLSAQRIVFGGGVLNDARLLPAIRASAARMLNGYPAVGSSAAELEGVIVRPALGERSGLCGAILLAQSSGRP
jgi:fructokinase